MIDFDFKEKIKDELSEEDRLVLESSDSDIKPKKRNLGLKIFAFVFAFLLIFTATALISGDSSESWIGKIPFIGRIAGLVESSEKQLRGEDKDRINILLLGMGGKKHEGGYLTDTIILASLKPSTKQVALLSIPRDLNIAVEGMGWQKINSINAFAERKKEGSGGEAISQALSDVLNIPIHYYVRVDFEGFVNIVDIVGGVEVEVENTLEDFRYPIAGQENNENYYARFEHLYIKKGLQKMDGSLALKYARSRYASGVEGSDFARARRQQKIIQAVKDELLKKENLFKPSVISGLLNEFNESLSFNLKIWEGIKLWQMFKDVNSESINNYVLDDGPSGLLVAGRSEAGAYILSPRSGDFTEIRYLIDGFFPKDEQVKAMNSESFQTAKLEIKNGTWINGLASQTAIDLEKKNFNILKISNCSRRDFIKTVIYDLTYGGKNEALKYLKDLLQADVYFDLPLWLAEDIKNEVKEEGEEVPDFLIILGENAAKIGF